MKHQTTGDLDDMKLIEGLTGEKNIYKRRAEEEPEVRGAGLGGVWWRERNIPLSTLIYSEIIGGGVRNIPPCIISE